MPLLLTDNVNAAPHLIYNISISARSTSNSTNSTISAAIPAIAGGTAAGVILAVVAVMGWKWWAFIVRYTNPKRQSGSSRQNVLRKRSRATPTKANEVPLSSTANINCNDAGYPYCQKDLKDSPAIITHPPPTTNHYPMVTTTPAPSGPPIKPPRNPARALRRSSKENTARAKSSFTRASNRLSYKASTVSTASVYSTQSEEQQTRVPAAVIVAALGHTFGTRRLSTLHHNPESYTIGEERIDSELVLPHQRLRHSIQNNNVDQSHRISNISDGSLGLQDGPYTIDPIGVAYTSEECEEQFYIPEGSFDREMAHSTDIH